MGTENMLERREKDISIAEAYLSHTSSLELT
jgi:hypothetical protein